MADVGGWTRLTELRTQRHPTFSKTGVSRLDRREAAHYVGVICSPLDTP